MQGLLIINKPKGITSFRAVACIKRVTDTRRVGHTGTLDPMATGVLPIFVGRATALSQFLLDADKGYTATFLFGTVTDTDDITGNIIEKKEPQITEQDILAALKRFTGKISQVPPDFSAIKKDGVPMYRRARRGEAVEIPAREVEIFSIRPEGGYKNNEITVSIKCSKGTYIRSLCRDIGEHLGCGATLKQLRRDFTAGFNLSQSVLLDNITPDNIGEYLISEETAVAHLRKISVSDKQAARFCNGGRLDVARLKFTPEENGELLRVCYGETFLGIGEYDSTLSEIKIKCIINTEI